MTWFRKSEKKKKKEFRHKIRGKEEDKIVKPPTYFACVLEYVENSPEAKVGLAKYNKAGSAQNAKTLTIQEMDHLKDNFEDYIREEYGGGDFRIAFLSPTKEIQATYDVSILGEDKKLGKKNKDGDGSSGGKKKKSDEILIDLAVKVVEKAMNGGDGGGGGAYEVLAEYLMKKEDNALIREEGAITKVSDILSIVREWGPQIPAPDPTTAIVQLIAQVAPPILTAIANRGSGAQQALPQQGGLTAPQAYAMLEAAPPDQRRQFEAAIQQATGITPSQLALLGQAAAPASAGAVSLPAPGAAAPATAPQTRQPQASQPAPAEIPAEHATFHMKLGQLREAASAGAPPEELADMILALIEASRLLCPENPHPLLRELTQEEDPGKLPAAMGRFFQTIPELSVDAGLQQAVGAALWELVGGEISEEALDEEAIVEEAKDEVILPGPTGLRSDGDGGGTEQQRTGEPTGEVVDAARPDHENVQSQVA